MNNWKEAPHLFLTGAFEFQDKDGEKIPNNSFTNFQFADWDDDKSTTKPCFYIEHVTDYQYKEINSCTLIARPISDMSAEELNKYHTLGYKNHVEVGRIQSPESFLYLLSIGVYPFNQKHFETGEVIARYENE